MPSTDLPPDVDTDKLAEAAVALLSLTLHAGGRVWKSLDWDLMDLLEEKGWIVEARSKAKSVVLTKEGERLAKEFLWRDFGPHSSKSAAITKDHVAEHFQMMTFVAEVVRALGGGILEHAYHPESFGSWWFRFTWGGRGGPDSRVVFDGRDGKLVLQHGSVHSQIPWRDVRQQVVEIGDTQAVLTAAKRLLEWHRHRPTLWAG